jgi:hypothetical protein
MKIQVSAFDKDSSSAFSQTIEFFNEKDFSKSVAQFEEEVPFSRYYTEVEDLFIDTTNELKDIAESYFGDLN